MDQIKPGDIRFIGNDLHRPECVLCLPDGGLAAADWRGGVTLIQPDGTQELIVADRKVAGETIKPNGIALDRNGNFIIAHMSENVGGVYMLTKEGVLSAILTEIGGVPLPPTNFVLIDSQDRIWVTISTRLFPRYESWTKDNADGFIVLIDDKGPRIVADNLGFTNELRLDASGEYLYVVETFARRIVRFRIADDGALQARETFIQFGAGTFPDGLAFDSEHGLWVTGIFANRLIRITPDRRAEILFEDQDPQVIESVESAFQAGEFAKGHGIAVPPAMLGDVSSIAFGGLDLKTAYLGALNADKIAYTRLPVAGQPLSHWYY